VDHRAGLLLLQRSGGTEHMVAAASDQARCGQREGQRGEGLTIHIVGFLGSDCFPGGGYQFDRVRAKRDSADATDCLVGTSNRKQRPSESIRPGCHGSTGDGLRMAGSKRCVRMNGPMQAIGPRWAICNAVNRTQAATTPPTHAMPLS